MARSGIRRMKVESFREGRTGNPLVGGDRHVDGWMGRISGQRAYQIRTGLLAADQIRVCKLISWVSGIIICRILAITRLHMLKNYFRVAIRNLLHNKIFSVINLLGLSMGISSAL